MDTHTVIFEAYLAGPKALRAAVAELSHQQRVARPVPGQWSIMEVICHLSDTDANIAHRLKRILSEERPSFERVQPDRMQAALAYHARDVEEELALIDLGRRQIIHILKSAQPESWDRTGVVGDRGDKTVTQMLNGAIEHVAHHLKFIIEKRQAMGLGNAGLVSLNSL